MTRFNSKIAAGVLVGLGLVYMIASVATGRSAVALNPPGTDLDGSTTGAGVWQAAGMMLDGKQTAAVIDIRTKEEFRRYHVPGSINEPGADANRIAKLSEKGSVILVAAKDQDASALAAGARAVSGKKNVFFLTGGARAWYLALDLPVPMFSDQNMPPGYESAIAALRDYFRNPSGADREKAKRALSALARVDYSPTLLGKAKKPASSGKKRKKIAGGCS